MVSEVLTVLVVFMSQEETIVSFGETRDHRLLETDTGLVRGAKRIEDLNTEGNGILVLGSGRLERGESHGSMLEGLS